MSVRPPGAPRVDLHALARDSTLVLAGNVAGGVCGFLVIVVVTRSLGSEAAGLFFQVVAIFTILAAVAQFGADTGLVRSISRYRALGTISDLPDTLKISVAPVLAVGIALALAAWFLAPSIASLVSGPRTAEDVTRYLRILLPFLPIAACATTLAAGSRGFGTMLPFVALEGFGKPVLRLLFMGAMVVLGLGAGTFLFVWAAPTALELAGAAGAVAVLYRRFAGREAARTVTPIGPLANAFWRFAAPRGLALVFQMGLLWLDVLLVGAILGPASAGIYAATSRLALVGLYALDATRIAIAPQISVHLARNERDDAQLLYRVGTWWLMAVSWPLYITVAMFAPFLLQVFGGRFTEGSHALMILVLGMLFALGVGNVTSVLLMGGASRWNLLNVVLALSTDLVLNLLLIPRLGIEGAAIAWAAAIVVENTAALIEVRAILRLDPFGRGYRLVAATTVLCFGIPGAVVRAFLGASLASLALFLVIAVPMYGLVLWRSRDALQLRTLFEALSPRRRRALDVVASLEGE